jgi:AcrR family transcriptional regulator
VIDDFIKAAGIARGTFYYYFKSTAELLKATSTWLAGDLVESIEKEVRVIKDPVARHGMGCRLWMRKAELDPAWCAFVAGTWFQEGFALAAPLRDLRLGIKAGGFHCPSANAAYDLAMGTLRQGMIRLMQNPKLRQAHYGDVIVQILLQGLGADPDKIAEIMKCPLPDIRRPTRTIE